MEESKVTDVDTVHAAIASGPGRSMALCGSKVGPLTTKPERITCNECKTHTEPKATTEGEKLPELLPCPFCGTSATVKQDGMGGVAVGVAGSEVEHTPTPWSLDIDELEREDDGNVIAGTICIRQIERCLHDTEWAESSDWQRDLANAEFIVEAVNNYDALRTERDTLRARVEELESGRDAKAIEAAKEIVANAIQGESFGPFCNLCRGPHDFDTVVPSVVWNRVIRAQRLPETLCTTCIVREFVRAGESFTASLWNSELNGVPIEVIVNGQNATDATAISEENTGYRVEIKDLKAKVAELSAANKDLTIKILPRR